MVISSTVVAYGVQEAIMAQAFDVFPAVRWVSKIASLCASETLSLCSSGLYIWRHIPMCLDGDKHCNLQFRWFR